MSDEDKMGVAGFVLFFVLVLFAIIYVSTYEECPKGGDHKFGVKRIRPSQTRFIFQFSVFSF